MSEYEYKRRWAEFLRTIGLSRKIGVALVDSSGVILDCTITFATLLERDKTELVGLNVHDISYGEDLKKTEAKLQALFSADGAGFVSSYKRYRSPRNTPLYRQLESHVVIEDDGKRRASISWIFEVPDAPQDHLDLQDQIDTIVHKVQQHFPSQVINMGQSHNYDHSTNADRGSTVNQGSGNQQGVNGAVIVSLAILAAAAILGVVALIAGGTVTFGSGGTSMQINEPAENADQN